MTSDAPDPGRQRERTAMAWLRTALALAGGCALLVRGAAGGGAVERGWTALGVGAALAALLCARLRYRAVLRDQQEAGRPAAPPVLLVAGMSTAMTAAGLAALVLLI